MPEPNPKPGMTFEEGKSPRDRGCPLGDLTPGDTFRYAEERRGESEDSGLWLVLSSRDGNPNYVSVASLASGCCKMPSKDHRVHPIHCDVTWRRL